MRLSKAKAECYQQARQAGTSNGASKHAVNVVDVADWGRGAYWS